MESQNFPENKKTDYKEIVIEKTDWRGNKTRYVKVFDRNTVETVYEIEKPRFILPGTVKKSLLRTESGQYIIEGKCGKKTYYSPISDNEAMSFVRNHDLDAYVRIFDPTLI